MKKSAKIQNPQKHLLVGAALKNTVFSSGGNKQPEKMSPCFSLSS